MNWFRACVFCLCVLVWSSAVAGPSLFQLAELLGNDFNDVVVVGDHAYAAGARGLTVFDVSIPDEPKAVRVTPLPGPATDIELVDGALYVAIDASDWLDDDGIEIFQPIPVEPHHLKSVAGSPGGSQIQLVGDYLYVAGEGEGLWVYDVSIAAAPILVSQVPMVLGDSLVDLLVDGTIAWLVVVYPYEDYSRTKVLKVDVTDPTVPVLDPVFNWDVVVHGPLNLINGLMHVPYFSTTRLYTPPSMTSAGQLSVSAHSFYPVPEGQLLDHDDGVSLMQGTTEKSTLELPGWGFEGDLEGDLLYRAGGRYGLQIVDVSDPLDLRLRSRVGGPWHLEAVIATGDIVYAAGRELYTIDVSNPSQPFITDRDPVYMTDAALDPRGYLFTSTSSGSIRSYDVANPAHPALLSEEAGGDANAIVESGGVLYVADDDFGLRILDAADPGSGLTELFKGAHTRAQLVAVYGDYAYVTDYDDCYVYDVRDPVSAVLVAQIPLGMGPDQILIAHDHLFAMDEYVGMNVYSLADPVAPVLVLDEFPGPLDNPRSMDHEGAHLAVADRSVIRLFDIRDPAAPIEVVSTELTIYQRLSGDLDLDGDTIHLASGSGYTSIGLDFAVAAPAFVPSGLVLGSYPNPARGFAQFFFDTPVRGPVELRLYNVAGRLVRSWLVDAVPDSRTEIFWDGTDRYGRSVAHGSYFLRARAGSVEGRHRLIWMR